MSRDLVKVAPSLIQWRPSIDMERDPLDHDRWSHADRHRVTDDDKYQSIVQRYVDGRPWAETPLFQTYARRLTYESVRGCHTLAALLVQYQTRVDALFADLRRHGYRAIVDGRPTPPIRAYVSHDNLVLMGDQGNHRLAMAQLLLLDHILVDIVGRHPASARGGVPLGMGGFAHAA